MQKHNPDNERIKRKYLAYLKDAKQQSEPSVDAAAKALARFEAYTRYGDFKAFRQQQAVAFKNHLSAQVSQTTGEKLSKATLHSTLAALKRFFEWLYLQPGFKSSFRLTDAEYFNISRKDARVATARREKTFPTLDQVRHTIGIMPHGTDVEKRDRAVVAFILLTGARDSAVASLKLKHVDLEAGTVFQDAREVKTKNSKTLTTTFFPVGDEIHGIVADWVTYLRKDKLWRNDDPLFPSTDVIRGASLHFERNGLSREHWSSASTIRSIFREAFKGADLPYFNPHSLRKTLVHLGMTLCRGDAEAFKSWSQNIGHESVLTSFFSYGVVEPGRQREIIQGLAKPKPAERSAAEEIADAILRKMDERQAAS